MEKKQKWIKRLLIIFAFIIYICGIFLIKKPDIENLTQSGIAHQEEYTYMDSEGEEHEGITLIDIKGIGKVFSYQDIYLESITMLLLSMVIGLVVFGRGKEGKCIIFANCVLGVLLIRLTTKANILPTIMFWLSLVAAYSADKIAKKEIR